MYISLYHILYIDRFWEQKRNIAPVFVELTVHKGYVNLQAMMETHRCNPGPHKKSVDSCNSKMEIKKWNK